MTHFTPSEERYLGARWLYEVARSLPNASPAWVEAAHEEYHAALAALRAEYEREKGKVA